MCTIDLFTTVLSFSTWKVYFKPDKSWVPVNQGFPLYEWNENDPFTMYTIRLFTVVLSFSSYKVRFKPDKFRVPVYQGFPLYEWNEKVSFKPDKLWVPVNQGFPSHEWNENHSSKVYTINLFTTVVSLCTCTIVLSFST